jgi:hypothetical protein
MTDLNFTYRLTLALASLGLLVSSLEYLTIISSFNLQGVYSWKVLRVRVISLPRWIQEWIDRYSSPRTIFVCLIIRILSILIALITPFNSLIFFFCMLYIVVFSVFFQFRRAFGDDGSDQMNFIVFITFLLCLSPLAGEMLKQFGIFFIALQSCISYATSGIAKLVSSTWRSGDAVYRILNTQSYGIQLLSSYLQKRPALNFLLCWSTILFETLFPVSLIAYGPWLWTFLIWGFLFHLSIAIVMGLNSFFWAFISTYPAIIYASAKISVALS